MFTAGLLVIKQNKFLLAYSNNKQAWYLPGGKIDKNETADEALIHEIKEELNIELKESGLKFYAHFTAPPIWRNKRVHHRLKYSNSAR